MHLRKSDDTMRAGLPLHVDTKSVHQNGTQINSDTRNRDKVEIPIEEQEIAMVFDTLLASWILLVQRYQRDSFQRFTWGLDQPGQDHNQCIETEQLDLSKLETAEDLLAMVRNVVSKESSGLMESSGVFFNDGTPDEVSSSKRIVRIVC
jgi:hypothetical protein